MTLLDKQARIFQAVRQSHSKTQVLGLGQLGVQPFASLRAVDFYLPAKSRPETIILSGRRQLFWLISASKFG